jgi:hypothetical protein
MIFKRELLLNALDILGPGLAASADVKAMRNVLFTGENLIAFNEQIGVVVPFETDFEASINHEDLMNILTKLDCSELEMALIDDEVRIRAESTEAGLLIESTEQIDKSLTTMRNSIPNDENGFEWTVLPKDFISGMLLCIMAADKSLQLQSLACLYAKDDELLCTDNDRISLYTMDGNVGSEFFLRAGLVKELERYAITHLCDTESWVFFTTEDDILFAITKMYADPLGATYIPLFDTFEGKAVKLPEGLKEVVTAASVMAVDTKVQAMEIVMQDGEMVCTTQNERGWVTKSIPMKSAGKKAVELHVSAAYLQQILDLPDLMMTIGEGKSLFTSGSFKHILIHRIEE